MPEWLASTKKIRWEPKVIGGEGAPFGLSTLKTFFLLFFSLKVGSRFGGRAWLNTGSKHPQCQDCHKTMTLLLQLDLEIIPLGEVFFSKKPSLLQLFICNSDEECDCGEVSFIIFIFIFFVFIIFFIAFWGNSFDPTS